MDIEIIINIYNKINKDFYIYKIIDILIINKYFEDDNRNKEIYINRNKLIYLIISIL
jgi:hypothetical protein